MQTKSKFIVAGICLFLFLFAFALTSFSAENKQEELQEVKQKLEKEKAILEKTKKEEQETLSKLVIVTKELKEADQDLRVAKRKVVVNESRIGVFSKAISQTEKSMQDKGAVLKTRVQQIYKGGASNYLELLFSSKSVADFINRSYYFGKILKRDSDLIMGLREESQKLSDNRTALKKSTNEIKEMAEVIVDRKEVIAKSAQEKQRLYESLRQRRQEYERRVAELEESSFELEKLITKSTTERRKAGKKAVSTGKFEWPLRGRLTSYFGYRRSPFWGGRNFHTGLDIAAPYGSSIMAADGGEVIFSGWWDGYGKAVVIDHGDGLSTVYGHMSRIYADNGSKIGKGEVIGLVGSTGYSTGPHLHFEVRKNGKPTDPLKWLP
ncbi:MAG: peptidoglycan DD-metalloendopeptidase family protein [Candidatus Saganbacteria bacterium]|nr:peptidoglycan DD-metalloendopeptidase family protein [Candidatus Saganbacteria bacterium]